LEAAMRVQNDYRKPAVNPSSSTTFPRKTRLSIAAMPRVLESQVLSVTADHAWGEIGTFCSVSRWQSSVARCSVEESDEGIVRTVIMKDNSAYVEKLESFSNASRSMSYSIISGPIQVKNYIAEITIDPEGPNARVTISAWYEVSPGADAVAIERTLSLLFCDGLKGMSILLNAEGL
jgi:Polyketide cyclase / dehydrase and lipid transport